MNVCMPQVGSPIVLVRLSLRCECKTPGGGGGVTSGEEHILKEISLKSSLHLLEHSVSFVFFRFLVSICMPADRKMYIIINATLFDQ